MKLEILFWLCLFVLVFSLVINSFLLYSFSDLSITGMVSAERDISPSNFIGDEKIEVYDDRVVIKIKGATKGKYAPSGSMLPLIDEETTGIKISPRSPDEIGEGDIITYEEGEELIVHRVLEKGEDNEGAYFITKGDNNRINDGKVRFPQIRSLTIGILY